MHVPLDAVRLGPADDAAEVTAAQLREVVERLIAAGHWQPGDPDIIVVLDAGYDLTRLAWLLRDLPVTVTGRLRSDRVIYRPPRAGAACRARPHAPGPRSGAAVTGSDAPRHRGRRDPARPGRGDGLAAAAPAAGRPGSGW